MERVGYELHGRVFWASLTRPVRTPYALVVDALEGIDITLSIQRCIEEASAL